VLEVDLTAGSYCLVVFDGRRGELDATPFGPLMDDVGEFAGAVVWLAGRDPMQGGECFLETVVCDRLAVGPVAPGVEGVEYGFDRCEVFGEVLPSGVEVVGGERGTGGLDLLAGLCSLRVRFAGVGSCGGE
jgi:hypothetical protein